MTPTSFTVNWNASAGVPSPQYQTQYRLTGTLPWTLNPLGTTSALTQTVSNLSPPSGSWDVQVIASNIAGSAAGPVPPLTVQLPTSQRVITANMVGNVEWTAAATVSTSGMLLNSTSGKITDATGATWTLVGSPLVVDRNGVVAGSGPGVQALLFFNGGVFYEGAALADWFQWNGSAWIATFDPRGAQPAASASGTTLTTTSGTIIDASGVTWSLVSATGLEAARNAIADPTVPNISLLLYFAGSIYAENSSSAWYQWSGSAWIGVTGDPRAQTIVLGQTATLTDSAGVVWALVNTNFGQVTRDGVVDTTSNNVTQLAYANGVMWRFVSSTGLWYHWTQTPIPTPTPTPTPAPVPPVTNIALTKATSNSLTVSWTAPDTVNTYAYEISLGSSAAGPFASPVFEPNTSWAFPPTLFAQTNYWVQITAESNAGFSVPVVVGPFSTTAASTPTPIPTATPVPTPTPTPSSTQTPATFEQRPLFVTANNVLTSPVVYFSTTFTVPNPPANPNAGQAILFWNALVSADGSILQPMLVWGKTSGWTIAGYYFGGGTPEVNLNSTQISVSSGTSVTAIMQCTATSGGTYNYTASFLGYTNILTITGIGLLTIPLLSFEQDGITTCQELPQGNVVFSNTTIKTGTPGTSGSAITPSWISNLNVGQTIACGLGLTVNSPSQVTLTMPNQGP